MQGVEFKISGITKKLFGTVVAVSADNLASKSLGGFIGLQSANRKCRFCLAVDADINSKVHIYDISS